MRLPTIVALQLLAIPGDPAGSLAQSCDRVRAVPSTFPDAHLVPGSLYELVGADVYSSEVFIAPDRGTPYQAGSGEEVITDVLERSSGIELAMYGGFVQPRPQGFGTEAAR